MIPRYLFTPIYFFETLLGRLDNPRNDLGAAIDAARENRIHQSKPMSDDTSSTTPTTDEPSEHDNLVDELTPSSVLAETPDVDIKQYVEAQKRAVRRARLILQFLAGVVIVAVPFAIYMRKTGHLSRSGLTGVVQPGGGRGTGDTGKPDPNFSLAKPPSSEEEGSVTPPATHTKRDPAVAKDLNDYIYKGLKTINPYERQALVAFQSVTGKNFGNSTVTFITVRSKVIPPYAEFVRRAEAIHPKTAPVQAIHRLFVYSAELKMRAFQHIVAGENDHTGLWQFGVKGEFDGSGQLANEFKSGITRLAEDQGVSMP